MEDPTQTNVICLVRPAAEITESQNTARDLQGEAYIEESVTRIPDEPKRSRTDIGRFGANKFPELSYTFANERKRKVVDRAGCPVHAWVQRSFSNVSLLDATLNGYHCGEAHQRIL